MEAFLCLLFFACIVFLNKRCGTNRSHKCSNPANDMPSYKVGNDFELHEIKHNIVNPANGLPMVGGYSGVDVDGNAYGTDFSRDLS
ncbi:MAG: hypothetical protein E6Q33_00915 [Neisseriales bacterium]|nr:MAG: hypothetical protein E6Q33_00915 [Neisseriales bacterium]